MANHYNQRHFARVELPGAMGSGEGDELCRFHIKGRLLVPGSLYINSMR